MLRGLVVSAALVLGSCAAHSSTGAGAKSGSPVARDRALSAIPLTALDGTRTTAAALLSGRPGLISLWASWCAACVEEMPALRRLHARIAPLGAVVLAVAVGEKQGPIAAYARQERLPWQVVCDEEFALADALGEKSLPATLVVDAGGAIVYSGGVLDEAALAALARVLPPAQR